MVLFGEAFAEDGHGGGQPACREHPGVFSAFAEGADLPLEEPQGGLLAFRRLDAETFRLESVQEGLPVRDEQGDREGRLVVVEHDLLDVRRSVGDSLLDNLRAILLAVAPDEQALHPAEDVEEAVGIEIAEVPRVEPAVAEGLARRLLVFPVAGHDVLAADDDLPGFSGRELAALVIADPEFEAGSDPSRGAELVGLQAVGRDDRRGLGQPVALEHGNAQGVEEPLELDVEQGPAADEELETAAEILPDLAEDELVVEGIEGLLQSLQAAALVPSLGVVVDGELQGLAEEGLDLGPLVADAFLDILPEVLGQSRHAQEKEGPCVADVLGDIAQGFHGRPAEFDRGHRGAAPHQGVDAAGVGEGVIPREDEQGHIVLGAVDESPRLFNVGRVVPMGEDDALGVGGRPRRVADVGVVAFLQGLICGLEFLLLRFQEFLASPKDFRSGDLVDGVSIELVQDDGHGQLGQVFPDLADLLGLGSRDDDQSASGVGQAELEVAELVHLDRYGHVDGPGEEDAELAHDPVPSAFGNEGGAIALAKAQAHQSRRELVDETAHLGICRRPVPLAALLPDEDVPGVSLDAVLEKPWKCPFGHGILLVRDKFSHATSDRSKCQKSFSGGPGRLIHRGPL